MNPRIAERHVQVSDNPVVELFVGQTAGDPDRSLLVIHGGPDWDQTYLHEPLVHLGGNRRVVFVDLRGCGRSTRGLPDGSYTPANAVQDLVALIETHGPEPVDVLGFSYGGLLAQRLLVTAPERVRRTIIASSSILPVDEQAFAGWAERDQRLAEQPPGTGDDDGNWTAERTRLDAVTSAAANVWRRELIPAYRDRLSQVHFSADWAAAWRTGRLPPARPDRVVERLAALAKPILLLHGRQDMTFPVALVEPTTDCIPTATGVILDDAGHMAHVDQPDAWLAAVRAFLDGAER
jgi:pimeloyl-ACP methyl ester carboxylesterase